MWQAPQAGTRRGRRTPQSVTNSSTTRRTREVLAARGINVFARARFARCRSGIRHSDCPQDSARREIRHASSVLQTQDFSDVNREDVDMDAVDGLPEVAQTC